MEVALMPNQGLPVARIGQVTYHCVGGIRETGRTVARHFCPSHDRHTRKSTVLVHPREIEVSFAHAVQSALFNFWLCMRP